VIATLSRNRVPLPPLDEIVTPNDETLKFVGSHVVPQRSVSDPTATMDVARQSSAAGGANGDAVPTTAPLRRSCAPNVPGSTCPARASTLIPVIVASSGMEKPKLVSVIDPGNGVVAQSPSVSLANDGLLQVPAAVLANRGPSESAAARLTPKPPYGVGSAAWNARIMANAPSNRPRRQRPRGRKSKPRTDGAVPGQRRPTGPLACAARRALQALAARDRRRRVRQHDGSV